MKDLLRHDLVPYHSRLTGGSGLRPSGDATHKWYPLARP